MTARQLHRVTPFWPSHGNSQNGVPAWTHDAPCRRDPDLWFSEDPADVEAAKAACLAECPLRRVIACMDYSFDNNIIWGVWGGVSRDERVEKTCGSCGEAKLLGEFWNDKHSPDGRHADCRACAAEANRRWRAAQPRPEVDVVALARRAAGLAKGQRQRTERAAQRETKFSELRDQGLTVAEAAAAVSVTPRQGNRYESRRLAKQEVAA